MSNNDWTSKLREQMTDYQETAKDDLWIGISQSLHAQNARKARIIKIRRWSAVAASVALLGVSGGYVYLHQNSQKESILASVPTQSIESQSIKIDRTSVYATAKAQGSAKSCVEPSLGGSLVASLGLEGAKSEAVELVSADKTPECTAETLMAETSAASSASSAAASSATPSQIVSGKKAPKKTESLVYDDDFKSVAKQQTVDWNVQLYAENGLLLSNDNLGGKPMMSSSFQDGTDGENGGFAYVASAPYASLLKTPSAPKAKHHAPISMGVQVGVRVAPRLSLTTGVVYTRTSSEFTSSDFSGYDTKQVLHYVGVPLSVHYEVWGTKRLHTYVMAGGEVDFNVKNDTEIDGVTLEDGVKKDKAQFSGKASLGVQYDVIPQVGIYLEPGAKYYFDNKSEVENTFKDKKLNFNLQFGLRFNLK